MTSVSVPNTMKGVQVTSFGGPEVLQYKTDLPVPTPRGGEILVKNEFIGVNYVDVLVLLYFLFRLLIFPIQRKKSKSLDLVFINSLIPDTGASA